jgi:uncharacterized surface protein with fasciclin (FAS1) repeats
LELHFEIMGNNNAFTLLVCILFMLNSGCEDFSNHEKYQRPDWLPGKLYTTVLAQENLSMYAECLRLAGLDTILDHSGSWTVFAPTDEAIKQYLSDNHYASISAIPSDKLERITEFHIIQNPWSLEQLKSLTSTGWRSVDDGNKNSYAYKRQTMFKNPVDKYWIKRSNNKERILPDSTISDGYKRVYVGSRKYVPIFYDKYFDVNGLTSDDYRFYFDREYERGNVYYAGAKILRADIFAENGFVHIIDRVVNPMLNARELLERDMPGESYRLFLELVYWYYPDFEPNIPATLNQPEIRQGGQADTLWDLNYSGLVFNLHNELAGTMNSTLVNHNGLYAPEDNAFRAFINGILTIQSGFPHWHDYKSLPPDIPGFIIGQNFKSVPLYPSTQQYRGIFRIGARYRQNEGDILRKEFGSNCTFIGLKSYIPDRVFTSVTGPVFCRPAFSLFRQAMIYSGVYDQIANYNGQLYFFPIPDGALGIDSSLILNWIDKDENRYNFMELNRSRDQIETLSSNTVRNRILNQVGTAISGGTENKQLIRTLRGYIITWDKSDNTIRGTLPSTIGYNGLTVTTCSPVPLDEPADNGKTWSVSYWFNFAN